MKTLDKNGQLDGMPFMPEMAAFCDRLLNHHPPLALPEVVEQVRIQPLGETSFAIPQESAEYLAADIRGNDPKKSVTVYVRREPGGLRVIGVDRTF